MQIDFFKVYRKTKTGKILYLSFSEYNLHKGVIKPIFVPKEKDAVLLNNWNIYYMQILCKEFLNKWKGKFLKKEIPLYFN